MIPPINNFQSSNIPNLGNLMLLCYIHTKKYMFYLTEAIFRSAEKLHMQRIQNLHNANNLTFKNRASYI
jgi:hypothetical protein